jgi:2-desacetyl-2-hydroxyethyl bacteriochlorophyllide A dehydrogenase
MKTILLEQPEQLRLLDTKPPEELGPGEALVRVGHVGVCGTDLHAFKGKQPFFDYPRILGHELGVEVVALGPIEENLGLSVGYRCAVEPYLECGRCSACRRGRANCCEKLKVLGVHTDGGMQELFVVPARKLHRSDSIPLDHLALVETLCIGAHAVERARLAKDETVLVIGAGPIGLSVIEFARSAGAKVLVMEISENRLAFCRERLGIDLAIDGKSDPVSQPRDLLSGDLPTAVFDATGNGASMQRAFDYVAHGGRLVFVGLFQGDVTFHDPDFHRREMTLLSSRNATREDFIQVIKTLEAGKIDLAPWITNRARPEEIVEEFPRWFEPESNVVKALLDF